MLKVVWWWLFCAVFKLGGYSCVVFVAKLIGNSKFLG